MKQKYLTVGFLVLFIDLLMFNIVHQYVFNTSTLIHTQESYLFSFITFNNLIWLLFFYVSGRYFCKKAKKPNKLIKATALSFVGLFFCDRMFINPVFYSYNFRNFYEDILICGAYLLVGRLMIVATVKLIYKLGFYKKKILIIGCNELTYKLIAQFEWRVFTHVIKGIFSDEDECNTDKYPIIGRVDDCVAYALENEIQEIYTVLSPEEDKRLYRIAEIAEQNFIRFKIVPDLNRYVKHGKNCGSDHELTIMTLRPEPLVDNVGGQLQKRIFDVVFSLVIIICILSWLAPLLALLIKIDSKGPVFFMQLRTGIKNRPFFCFKFRSLIVNYGADDRQVTKDDSRYTRLGKFLRKSNLDELPQFLNVLAGDMSVVGSRPHMLKHTEVYSSLHSKYMLRHNVKPGLTGWAQINGFRGEIKIDEQLINRVDHDLWYIENWNFWLDLRIVFQTVSGTFKGDKNAY